MNILSIGDTHGNSVLDDIKKVMDKYDKIVFIGDYVDSFTLDNLTINKNLYDLIEFKKENPDKVILLWGNHDIQYLFPSKIHLCSGYRPEVNIDLYDIFHKNKDLFQVAYQKDNYIWTHAGVTIGWYKYRFHKFRKNHDIETISDQLNLAFDLYEESLFDVGYRRGGSYDVGGPFWADKAEMLKSPLEGYHQIVGHSKVEDHRTVYTHNDASVTFIDVIENHLRKYEYLRKNSFYPLKIN